jgi:N-acetylmuramic acid 6-phosphate etherase
MSTPVSPPAGHPSHSGDVDPATVTTSQPSVPLTEARNPRTVYLDRLPARDAVRLWVQEEQAVTAALSGAADSIARAVDLIAGDVRRQGRLIYLGAGTSGRLGLLDASECPPTFGVDPGLVQAVLAGGRDAMFAAREGAEDDRNAGAVDLQAIALHAPDVVVGITASGRTPYVLGGLSHARLIGCHTVLLYCNPIPPAIEVDIAINPVVGPEVLTGSTRLKSGTVCKIVLNMVSTLVMTRLGKVYQNLMIDVRATNNKLRERARRIVMEGGRVPNYQADACLEDADGEVKTAIYLARKGGTAEEARKVLAAAGGVLYRALGEDDFHAIDTAHPTAGTPQPDVHPEPPSGGPR